ncbi:MAG: PAS domain-containing protein [Alphaproteobacteria bacterium]|nr:PAS domain-containing protein [Alphaproteobacteria bacterium]MBU0804276.1 PAS domain-containing protein [Alphaproteobacteria bacterium]MBU0871107.1 PAS domain-containing protein [Alphaproteobacteria bacterium]MBU1400862.1 PAS domain-containing protein [Alphaproteobacteria bacterium]MBU1592721.1 PAS domain-containing protein [Alphaproteobacteria bacterium]
MRRLTDNRLEESSLKLRLALRAARMGVWDWTIDTGEMNYSPRAREIYGFTPDEAVTIDKVRGATHPEDLPRTSALAKLALNPSIRSREPYEYRVLRADNGQERWLLAHGEAIFEEIEGVTRATRYLGTIEDITSRKATELALQESERRKRLALEGARMAVWELDLATDALTSSAELNRIYGLPADSHPTVEELRNFYAPGERERIQEIGMRAIAEGRSDFEAEYRIRRPDGKIVWLLLRAEVVSDEDGRMTRVIGVVMDIDERKRSEESQKILMRELAHRVKNSLSVVQSIATQSFRGGRADPAALNTFRNRLVALADANEVLLNKDWSGFRLRELVDRIVAPYRDPHDRIEVSGPDLDLPARLNVPLALTLHELCTNASKYGALSSPAGKLSVRWEKSGEGEIDLLWVEQGGPPIEGQPAKGFGLRLISEILSVELGAVELSAAEPGLRCRIKLLV